MKHLLLSFLCGLMNVSLSKQKVQPEIVNLGFSIVKQLANDTVENADLLYENFSTYLKLLQEINDLIWSKNGEVVSKGMRIFNDLEEAGGPPHSNFDYKLLAEKYNWQEEKIKRLVNDTKVLWDTVKDRANRLRIGTWGVDSKVEEPEAPDGSDDSDGELH